MKKTYKEFVDAMSKTHLMTREFERRLKKHPDFLNVVCRGVESGDAVYQFVLGQLYKHGIFAEPDDEIGYKYYELSAEQGYLPAQIALGDAYICEYQYDLGMKWLQVAAAQNSSEAQYRIGLAYQHGEGVPQNHRKAVAWHRKAALQNHVLAMHNLGACYANGTGVKKDNRIAVQWHLKSASLGDMFSQAWLGASYQFGIEIKKNYKEAAKWYRMAAEQGDSYSQNNLGYLYWSGKGVAKDYGEAIKWYRRAAKQEDVFRKDRNSAVDTAQCNLGVCYSKGQGVKKSMENAVKWYRKAAEKGDDKAQYSLGRCYEKGEGVKKDLAIATHWFIKAACQKHKEAAEKLVAISYALKKFSCAAYWVKVAKKLESKKVGKWTEILKSSKRKEALNHLSFKVEGNQIRTLIDGKVIQGDWVYPDFWEMLSAVEKNGDYTCLLCSCGVPGCVGKDETFHTFRHGNVIAWNIEVPEPARMVSFEISDYLHAIRDGLRQTLKYLEEHKDIRENAEEPSMDDLPWWHNLDCVKGTLDDIERTMSQIKIDLSEWEKIEWPQTLQNKRILAVAKRGDANAQFKAGQIYDTSDCIDRDDDGRLYKMGMFFFDPDEARLDKSELEDYDKVESREVYIDDLVKEGRKAFVWYHKAAKQGHLEAIEKVAGCYGWGYGVKKNKALANRWWRKAEKLGSKLAQRYLVRL